MEDLPHADGLPFARKDEMSAPFILAPLSGGQAEGGTTPQRKMSAVGVDPTIWGRERRELT